MANEQKYEVWKAGDGQWYWHFKAGNGEIVGSGEGYKSKDGAVHACYLLKGSEEAKVYNLTPEEK